MEMFYFCDRVISDDVNPRLPIAEIQELNDVMQCNLEFSDESEKWLDAPEQLPEHMSIVDEMSQMCWDSENLIWSY
jgi:hypothetical protein